MWMIVADGVVMVIDGVKHARVAKLQGGLDTQNPTRVDAVD